MDIQLSQEHLENFSWNRSGFSIQLEQCSAGFFIESISNEIETYQMMLNDAPSLQLVAYEEELPKLKRKLDSESKHYDLSNSKIYLLAKSIDTLDEEISDLEKSIASLGKENVVNYSQDFLLLSENLEGVKKDRHQQALLLDNVIIECSGNAENTRGYQRALRDTEMQYQEAVQIRAELAKSIQRLKNQLKWLEDIRSCNRGVFALTFSIESENSISSLLISLKKELIVFQNHQESEKQYYLHELIEDLEVKSKNWKKMWRDACRNSLPCPQFKLIVHPSLQEVVMRSIKNR